MLKICLLFMVAAAAIQCVRAAEDTPQRVKVTVYYESLCNDSRRFITEQLTPTLNGELGKHVDLTLLPFGKAKYQVNGNSIEFQCHHGEPECKGNKIHACALKLIDEGHDSTGYGYNNVTVNFISCLMAEIVWKSPPEFPTNDCAAKMHVYNLSNVTNCANHPLGSQYLANIGATTESLRPQLSSVPTIVFGPTYDKRLNDLAQTDFKLALCQHIVADRPEECKAIGGAGRNAALALLATICFLLHRLL